jgi:hypothetical protein
MRQPRLVSRLLHFIYDPVVTAPGFQLDLRSGRQFPQEFAEDLAVLPE